MQASSSRVAKALEAGKGSVGVYWQGGATGRWRQERVVGISQYEHVRNQRDVRGNVYHHFPEGSQWLKGGDCRTRGQGSPAGCLLHPLVAIQDALEQFCHQRLEVHVGWLADYPVGIAAQRPAGNGADQGLFVRQALDKVWD